MKKLIHQHIALAKISQNHYQQIKICCDSEHRSLELYGFPVLGIVRTWP